MNLNSKENSTQELTKKKTEEMNVDVRDFYFPLRMRYKFKE